MTVKASHDRGYFQERLREEIDRARRYGHVFTLVVFEALPSEGAPMRRKVETAEEFIVSHLRTTDIIGHVFEDTIGVILVETDAHGAHDATFRIRAHLAQISGGWTIAAYAFPAQAEEIAQLPLLLAA